MIDFNTVWELVKIDPIACGLIFMIYLNTRTFAKRLGNVESRVTILETNKGEEIHV